MHLIYIATELSGLHADRSQYRWLLTNRFSQKNINNYELKYEFLITSDENFTLTYQRIEKDEIVEPYLYI